MVGQRVIVVGGGLSGLSAAHTVIQHGGRVVLLDKSPFCGGNSTKATSGINAAGTSSQRAVGIQDSAEVFFQDTKVSAAELARDYLIKTLTFESAPSIEWLKDSFDLDLSVIARLAAHSNPRTHRGKELFPGMMITYRLLERFEELCEKKDGTAQLINKAEVKDLIVDEQTNEVTGVVFDKGGKSYEEHGPVILCTGGFGADFTDNSYLAQVSEQFAKMDAWSTSSRAAKQSGGKKVPMPNLRSLPTTNGAHCTGDGLRLGQKVGAAFRDLHCVQIHPTGLIDPKEPDAKVKFLAAEALRGSGGVLLNNKGERFCDELGKRDYVSGRILLDGNAPHRLCLNGKASALIQWHCDHYVARGLMKKMTGKELAKEIGVSPEKLQKTFNEYNKAAENPDTDKWGKQYFEATPLNVNDDIWHVAQITPLIHYCMGGIATDGDGQVVDRDEKVVPGLFAGGELIGGIHGVNRLGGSSLLDCVVYGRQSGKSAARYLLSNLLAGGSANAGTGAFDLHVDPASSSVTVSWGGKKSGKQGNVNELNDDSSGDVDENASFYASGTEKKETKMQAYTMEEVGEHTTEQDCWVVLNGEVFDVTSFLADHPGGARAILMYAGKDATEPFKMLHDEAIIQKYGADLRIGTVSQGSKL